MEFEITSLTESSVLRLVDIRDRIKIDPDYQRPGGVWSLENKQLFIDSLLNRYDIPKLYFHDLRDRESGNGYRYAIIDGRQRLEAIWGFFDGKFALADEFSYFDDPTIMAGGMGYEELAERHPKLLSRLHSRTLDVQIVDTDDDSIEDMFSRLNEAVPLNAAEKRNAFGGPIPPMIRTLADHEFFTRKISISSTRYRHMDIAAKMLYLQHRDSFVDTKRASLDHFVKHPELLDIGKLEESASNVGTALSDMCNVFNNRDTLLRSSGVVIVYFVLATKLRNLNRHERLTREALSNFEAKRKQNRERFEQNEDEVDFKLIEFDELIRSSNDGSSIQRRFEVLLEELEES